MAALSTDDEPVIFFYETSVADALAAGDPFLLIFSTPAFCRTATCGPALDIVKTVAPEFQERVTFIHVEPYQLEMANGQLQPVLRDGQALMAKPLVFFRGPDEKDKRVPTFRKGMAPHELVSLFTANQRFTSLANFPFQPLGLAALLILFVMAATSHDFWLRNLTAPVWKRLHMLVYAAYALLVAHVTLGALQSETSPLLAALLGFSGLRLPRRMIGPRITHEDGKRDREQNDASGEYPIALPPADEPGGDEGRAAPQGHPPPPLRSGFHHQGRAEDAARIRLADRHRARQGGRGAVARNDRARRADACARPAR